VVLSLPHAGLNVPEELADICLLSAAQIAKDGDEQAAEIYDLADHVVQCVTTPIARAILDMNRAPDDFRRDGVVKTHTCWEEPIYRRALVPAEIDRLLGLHAEYHRRLTAAARRSDVVLGIDCHTMAATGPPIGPDPGRQRPHVCLSDGDGQTLPPARMQGLADCFRAAFGAQVQVNTPFSGGYIIRRHGHALPWLQLELSRGPFASVQEKRERVLRALKAFCKGPTCHAPAGRG
jgi:formiminoglutamase